MTEKPTTLDYKNLGLSEQDVANLDIIFDKLPKIANDKYGVQYKLKIAGGKVTGRGTGKDIDVLVIMPIKIGNTAYDRALLEYTEFVDIVSDIASRTGFSISEKNEPAVDHDLDDNPNVIIHRGSIVLKSKAGTPIELIRTN